MVFKTFINFVRQKGPDEFWRKRKIFKLSAHYRNRGRNCYSIAIKNVQRALVYATKARRQKKIDFKELHEARISAASEQFGIDFFSFRRALFQQNIMLNRKTLADLSIWEPKTFEALARISREKAAENGLNLHEKALDNDVYLYNNEKSEKEAKQNKV